MSRAITTFTPRVVQQEGWYEGDVFVQSEYPVELYAILVTVNGEPVGGQLFTEAATAKAFMEQARRRAREDPDCLPYIGPTPKATP
ncbi:hypothetical protein [Aquamicrobium ahrensii]|uniref:Uncharacterized protein n=1 Tax=Aquamicrobium ahrensii TaxID=469551 RepID=A0ABV2KFW4_9HYPH